MKKELYPVLVGSCVLLSICCFTDLYCIDSHYLSTLAHPTVEAISKRPPDLMKKRRLKKSQSTKTIVEQPPTTAQSHSDSGAALYPVDSLRVTEVPTALPSSASSEQPSELNHSYPVQVTP
jgi:hypothetical protein